MCAHLGSRASYRSPSPITCEFTHRSCLCGPNSIYLVRARDRDKPKKDEKRRERERAQFPIDLLPVRRGPGQGVPIAQVLFDLSGCYFRRTAWREMFVFNLLVRTNTWRLRKRIFYVYCIKKILVYTGIFVQIFSTKYIFIRWQTWGKLKLLHF